MVVTTRVTVSEVGMIDSSRRRRGSAFNVGAFTPQRIPAPAVAYSSAFTKFAEEPVVRVFRDFGDRGRPSKRHAASRPSARVNFLSPALASGVQSPLGLQAPPRSLAEVDHQIRGRPRSEMARGGCAAAMRFDKCDGRRPNNAC